MKKIYYFLTILVLCVLPVIQATAQCPMCRMTAESNMQNGGTMGAGLNAGILYMLVAPYLIVGGIAFWWWRNRKKEDIDEDEDTSEWVRAVNEPGALN